MMPLLSPQPSLRVPKRQNPADLLAAGRSGVAGAGSVSREKMAEGAGGR
jgi:hypothetical protein